MEVSFAGWMILDKFVGRRGGEIAGGCADRIGEFRSTERANASALEMAGRRTKIMAGAMAAGFCLRPGSSSSIAGRGFRNAARLLRGVARLSPATTFQASRTFPIGLLRAIRSTAGGVGSAEASSARIGIP
jgi:hypothetical protein